MRDAEIRNSRALDRDALLRIHAGIIFLNCGGNWHGLNLSHRTRCAKWENGKGIACKWDGGTAFFPPPMKSRALVFYGYLRDLLDDYVAVCQPHEVVLRDDISEQTPATMLAILSPDILDAPIVLTEGGKGPDRITTRLPDGTNQTYELIWHPDRYGWTQTYTGSAVHFVAPREWFKDPPYGWELPALCKRSGTHNDAPFWPVEDPEYCKRCAARYESFLAHINGGGEKRAWKWDGGK